MLGNGKITLGKTGMSHRSCAKKTLLIVGVLVVLFSLLTGGGINLLSYYSYEYHQSEQELFDGCRCYIFIERGNIVRSKIPFLFFIGNESNQRDIKIILKNSGNENVTLKMIYMVLSTSTSESTFVIDKSFQFSEGISWEDEHIDISSALTKDESVIFVRLHGVIERERFGDQEFIIEYRIVINVITAVFSGWSNILDSYPPPSLGGP